MAIAVQGFTVTFGGQSLVEVREIDVDQERGQPLARFGTWTLERGSVRITAFSMAAVPESLYGLRRTLTITAPAAGVIFSEPCVYENRQVRVAANDTVRFDFIFRIID
jgi:hypothetical protein